MQGRVGVSGPFARLIGLGMSDFYGFAWSLSLVSVSSSFFRD